MTRIDGSSVSVRTRRGSGDGVSQDGHLMPFFYTHPRLTSRVVNGPAFDRVVPTVGAVMPAAAGNDIGCGITAAQTPLTVDDIPSDEDALADLSELITAAIPMTSPGPFQGLSKSAATRIIRLERSATAADFDPDQYYVNWRLEFGTLGHGNHSVLLCTDETGTLWVLVHSGSRSVGNAIAHHHQRVAKALSRKYQNDLPDENCAYLIEGTTAFDAYVAQAQWAQSFADASRDEMTDRAISCLAAWAASQSRMPDPRGEAQRVNCRHNFTKRDHHLGTPIWLSCKGAISTRSGEPGVVPGTTGASMFVVEGESNRSTWYRLPNDTRGAGRVTASPPAVARLPPPRETSLQSAPTSTERIPNLRATDQETRLFTTGDLGTLQLTHVLRPFLAHQWTA